MIVDASVLVAVVVPTDAFHGIARAWLAAVPPVEAVVSPAIALPEIAGAVRRVTGSRESAAEAIERFRSGRLKFVSADAELCEEAAHIAGTLGIKGCDAIYLAIAQQFRQTLFTFDREQLERGGAVVRVERPS